MKYIRFEAVDQNGKKYQKTYSAIELESIRFLPGSVIDKTEHRKKLIELLSSKAYKHFDNLLKEKDKRICSFSYIMSSNLNEGDVDMEYSAKEIIGLLQNKRFDLSNEKNLQMQISIILQQANIGFNREYVLDPQTRRSIIDFLIAGVGIEVKIGGSKKDIYRQIVRYCKFEEVKEIILVTSVSMTLPSNVSGKRAYVFNLNRAWL